MKAFHLPQLLAIVLLLLSGCTKNEHSEDIKSNGNHPERVRVLSERQAKAFAQQALAGLLNFDKDAPMTRTDSESYATPPEAEEVITLSSNGIPALYIVNFTGDNGYMGISADKEQGNPMLIFAEQGHFELSMLEEDSPLASYINEKVEIIVENLSQPGNGDDGSYDKWEYLGNAIIDENGYKVETVVTLVSVPSLEDDTMFDSSETRARHRCPKGLQYISPGKAALLKWGQENGYNADAPRPNYDRAGCAAIAIGQLCFINRYPPIYDYSKMGYILEPTMLSTPTSKMLRSIGDKIPGYEWGPEATSSNEFGIVSALKTLGYTDAECLDYDFDRTYAEMDNGRPVLLSGYGDVPGRGRRGHVWLCNGYQEMVWRFEETRWFWHILWLVYEKTVWYEYADYLYMNWGWYGNGNAWVDQEDWLTNHHQYGELSLNSKRKGYYNLVPKKTKWPIALDGGNSFELVGGISPGTGSTVRPVNP